MTLSAVSVRDTCLFSFRVDSLLLNVNIEWCMLTINRFLLIEVACHINCMILKVSEQSHKVYIFLLLNRVGISRSLYLLFKFRVFVIFRILASAKKKRSCILAGYTCFSNTYCMCLLGWSNSKDVKFVLSLTFIHRNEKNTHCFSAERALLFPFLLNAIL